MRLPSCHLHCRLKAEEEGEVEAVEQVAVEEEEEVAVERAAVEEEAEVEVEAGIGGGKQPSCHLHCRLKAEEEGEVEAVEQVAVEEEEEVAAVKERRQAGGCREPFICKPNSAHPPP